MSERYWIAGDPPDALLDWVDENVCDAIEHAWNQENRTAWIEVVGEDIVLVIAGPEKPEVRGEKSDIYTFRFLVEEELSEYAKPYEYLVTNKHKGKPLSDEQKEDMRERSDVLNKLANKILDMAAEADELGKEG